MNDLSEMTPHSGYAGNNFGKPLECSCPGRKDGVPCGSECMSCDPTEPTEERRLWFAEAARNDVGLGRQLVTFGFLPLEIREKFWYAIISIYEESFTKEFENIVKKVELRIIEETIEAGSRSSGPMACYASLTGTSVYDETFDGLDVFNFSAYQSFQDETISSAGAMALRDVSPDIKMELEKPFLFTKAFRLSCPEVLNHFLNQLPAHAQLRTLFIKPFSCSSCVDPGFSSLSPLKRRPSGLQTVCRAWLNLIDRLPDTIQSLTFELDPSELYDYTGADNPVSTRCPELPVKWLDSLTTRCRRRLPRAEISLTGLNDWRYAGDRALVQNVINQARTDGVDGQALEFAAAPRSWC